MIRGKNPKELISKPLNFDVFNKILEINLGLSDKEYADQFPIIVHSEEEYQKYLSWGWTNTTFIKKYKNE
tara:strand:+ start:305 stop:514 length:210 start_codon:yes stop_codon:yes gene_type:complete